jgi:AGZA family xanthine/uracil permease-like MFS transporter
MLSRFFKLAENRTTFGREIAAGFTTFAAMAYILAVNPAILMNGFAVDPAIGADPGSASYLAVKGALLAATAITAALATILMAFLTNYPLAQAPGMGINAFFAFSICIGAGVPWQQALGMVFVNGCIFLALSLTGVREKIVRAIPYSLKIAISCGIGIFLAFIGLKNAGVIVSHPDTFVTPGNFASPPVALALAGIILTAVLVARKTPGGILLGIGVITVAGFFIPDGAGGTVTARPASLGALVSAPPSLAPVFLKLDLSFLGDFSALLKVLPLILTLLLVDMFDNIGTLIGVTKRAGLLDQNGQLPKAGRALLADSVAAILSSLFGTSTVVSYIESASGVEAGGRTGVTALTVAALMLLALFLSPLILLIPAAATAPALVVVGVFMLQAVNEIDMADFLVAVPASLVIICIPLTFSIAEGIGFGLISAALLALFAGKPKTLPALGYVIAAFFFLSFFKLPPFHVAN